ncbi:hypothetical protein K1719_015038 [Acacia pycnantha]|nr:hypothetical protein K1719_015038 [Acacia pycnantha]
MVPEKPSFSGSLLIRAPLTLDDSEFDASSNGTYICSRSESEGFVSGDESEMPSSRPLIVDPEAYPMGNACEGEEGSAELDTSLRVTPFAQLSGYDDYDEEEVSYEMEGDENFNAMRVPSIDIPKDFVNLPRIKVADVDTEELETSTWRDSLTVNQAFITKDWTAANHMTSDDFTEQLSVDMSENFVGFPRIKAVNVEEEELETLMSRTVQQSFAANEFTVADYRSSVNFIEHDNFDMPETFIGLPRIKVLNAEEEELETLMLRDFSTVDQSYNAKDLTFVDHLGSDYIIEDEIGDESFMADKMLGEVEHKQTPDEDLEDRVAEEGYSVATDTCIILQDSRTRLNTEQLGRVKIASDELENEEDLKLDDMYSVEGETINIVEVGAVRMKSMAQRKLEVNAKEATKMGEGTSVMIGDFSLLKSNIEDPKKSKRLKTNTSAHVLQEQNPETQLELVSDAKSIECTGSESCLSTQEAVADGSQGFGVDFKCENEKLRSIYKSTINSKINLNDASAGFEFNDNDACEGKNFPTADSAKFLELELFQQTVYLENDLEDKLCIDCHSHEHAERGPNLGETVKREPTADFSSISQESKRAGSAMVGDVEGLISAGHEHFMEQISALSVLLGSEGSSSEKNCQQEQPGQNSHGRLNLLKDNEYFLHAINSGELNCSRLTIANVDESSIITVKDLPSLSSSLDFEGQNGFKHNVSDKENEKVKKIQAISVKFLRLVQRINLSLKDPFVLKILSRLVADIGGLSAQDFVIESAKILAKKLEEKHDDDLDFSLNILVLGRSGVGKSAIINSIFGETKVMTSAFEPATTSVKEVTGTIQGIKIRILDTPGLRPPMKEQAFNRNILASIKRYMKKFPLDVILYVDRVDSQTWDFSDLPLLKSITGSLNKSIWQRTILTLTHAASPPWDDPSGFPLRYEAFVAQKANIVQQLIRQAAGDMCQGNSSFMCPVSLVENHPLCGKNKDGECLLAGGLEWRSQLLALCISLKILCEVSSTKGPQTLLGQWRHFFCQNQNHSSSMSHPLSSLMQFPSQPIFSGSWR